MFAPRAQFDIKIIRNDDRLTHCYTGMPKFDLFMGLVEYLEPKAKGLISLNEKYTKKPVIQTITSVELKFTNFCSFGKVMACTFCHQYICTICNG